MCKCQHGTFATALFFFVKISRFRYLQHVSRQSRHFPFRTAYRLACRTYRRSSLHRHSGKAFMCEAARRLKCAGIGKTIEESRQWGLYFVHVRRSCFYMNIFTREWWPHTTISIKPQRLTRNCFLARFAFSVSRVLFMLPSVNLDPYIRSRIKSYLTQWTQCVVILKWNPRSPAQLIINLWHKQIAGLVCEKVVTPKPYLPDHLLQPYITIYKLSYEWACSS